MPPDPPVTVATPAIRAFSSALLGSAPRSVGGSGYRGLLWPGGNHGPRDFCAPDEQEGDRDAGQSGEPGNPERPLESVGERGRRGVALAQQEAGVGRGNGGG